MRELVAGVAARMLQPAVSQLIRAGVDVDAVLAATGVNLESLKDQQARVLHGVALRLWQEAALVTGDDDFGIHAAEALDFGVLDVQAYAVLTSASLQEGLERACRYQRLQHDATVLSLALDGDGGRVTYSVPGGRVLPRQPAEFLAAGIVRLARQATGVQLVPLDVTFAHAAPAQLGEHRRVFGIAPNFGVHEFSFSMRLSREQLSMPLLKADPALQSVLDRHAAALLAELPKVSNFIEQVRSIITRELTTGDPTRETTAAKLHMSPRTLSARLQEYGTTYRALLEELREELAKRYLNESKLEIGEVAFLLGFSEASAFHRAFKRWTGLTAAEFRDGGVR